ncbi:hypothetical protein F0562_021727 [Nyssa sinensis]|uniref:NTF2 domain-containing protein n=1 Tax=Nyssa sinensis TaxID=561372 RepID=A0A5J5BNX6_9ASTE|nr:hypothetical protein F0562_020986 [Nyssa sinensis]KAA8543527.1 hypothetical protein F0562_021727 [Nyssa sinensis]
MSITTTMKAINEKILSLNYGEFRAEIKSVDSQESLDGGVHVLVTGYLTANDNNVIRNFAQTFFLAPQDRGYFVLNDIFRYVEDVNHHDGNQSSTNDVEGPVISEQAQQDPTPVQESHTPEQMTDLAEEADGEEVFNPLDNGEVSVVEEEEPVPEVVDEVQDDSQMVVESNSKIEEVPKKSYASIVMDMKESAVPFSSPAPAPVPVPWRSVPKNQEQVNSAPPPVSVAETPVSSSDVLENGNNQEGEGDSYSIYIKGLPMNASTDLLEDEFKRFGPIKSGGIQVRSNRQQGFCFGFVEFEVASAVQQAIEASPITIGGWQAYVEEKRSTNSRVNTNRGRLPNGRGSSFRSDGARGRGYYGGNRGYSRGDFNGRNEFGNRGSNRGGFSNRGGDGYQRADNTGNNGGRMNRAGGMANGTAKTMAPRVSASA